MKPARILTGITTVLSATALSVALMACGDESSSTAPEQPISGGESSSVEELSSSSELPPQSSSVDVRGMSSMTCCRIYSSSSLGDVIESSSSELPPESSSAITSSSSVQQDKLVQSVSDVSGVCIEKNQKDPLTDAALPPVAYMTLDGDSATIVLERVRTSCEAVSGITSVIQNPTVSALDVRASGDTLYVKPTVSQIAIEKNVACICEARIAFKIKADSAFTSASLLVVEDELNLGDRMRIVNMEPPKYELDEDPLKSSGLTRGTCMDKPVPSENLYDGLPVADYTVYENGLAIMKLTNVEDNCGIKAKLSQKVVDRDTLVFEYYDIEAQANCICTFDSYEIEVKNENAGFRYAKFNGVVYYVNYITYTKIPDWEP